MVYWEITAQSCSSALHSSLKFPTHQVDGDSTKTVTLSGSVPNSSDGLIFVKGWVKDGRFVSKNTGNRHKMGEKTEKIQFFIKEN